MEGLAGCLAEVLLGPVLELLIKLALLPIFLIAATPVILVLGLWSLPSYFAAVRFRYSQVVACWRSLARHA